MKEERKKGDKVEYSYGRTRQRERQDEQQEKRRSGWIPKRKNTGQTMKGDGGREKCGKGRVRGKGEEWRGRSEGGREGKEKRRKEE